MTAGSKSARSGADDPVAGTGEFLSRELRAALGCFTTGVTVVTAILPDGRRAGVTCNSFASVSLDPPLVLWSLLATSSSLPVFDLASRFAVNVLAAGQQALALQFSRSSHDKFADTQLTRSALGSLLLPGCRASFECRKIDRYYGGDHVIFLGQIEEFAFREAEPLVFDSGRFRALIEDRG